MVCNNNSKTTQFLLKKGGSGLANKEISGGPLNWYGINSLSLWKEKCKKNNGHMKSSKRNMHCIVVATTKWIGHQTTVNADAKHRWFVDRKKVC